MHLPAAARHGRALDTAAANPYPFSDQAFPGQLCTGPGAEEVWIMADDPFAERVRALEERIRRAEAGRAKPPPRRAGYEHSSLAYRMVTELVVGMGLGVAIGYGLDSLLETWPIFLVIFSLLGFAAGVKTMLRSAEEVQKGRPVDTPPGAAGDKGRGREGPTE